MTDPTTIAVARVLIGVPWPLRLADLAVGAGLPEPAVERAVANADWFALGAGGEVALTPLGRADLAGGLRR